MLGRRTFLGGIAFGALACRGQPAPATAASPAPPVARRTATPSEFLDACARKVRKDLTLYVPPHRSAASNVYDDALVALSLLRRSRHADAGYVLGALARAQSTDGSVRFNVELAANDPQPPYVRTGAVAWVGYAAAEYLDGERTGPYRDAIARAAHLTARYVLRRVVDAPSDPRSGLVTGGRGRYRQDSNGKRLREVFVDGDQPWISTEHNIDTFFLLRALGRVSGEDTYLAASKWIADALVARLWSDEHGQLFRGASSDGVDKTLALDCASWGGLMLLAAGDRARAERSLAAAQRAYATTTPAGVVGHKPYASGPLIENAALRAHLGAPWTTADWSSSRIVWPEGTAGVALLALRLGDADGARASLAALDRLRNADGSLPTATDEIPFELDTNPAIAGTAWVELVRAELDGGAKLWV